jgi:hypothetical protein
MPRRRTTLLLLSIGLVLLSAPAAAQGLEQVQGFVATATLRYRATFANMLGSAPGYVTFNYQVRIADGVANASVSRNVEADTSMGQGLGSASRSFGGAIVQPGQSNYGQYLWSFSNGVLTLLAPPETGGYQFSVRFYQDPRGIMCTAAAPYVGNNATNLSQLAFGGQVIIAEMEQIGSFCAVSTS